MIGFVWICIRIKRKKERTVTIRTVPRYTKGKIKTFVWTEVLIDSTHGGNILCAILFVSTPSQESECGRESGDLFDQFILKLSRMQQRKFYNFGQIWNELLFHSPVGFNFNFVIKSKQNSCCVTQLVEQSLPSPEIHGSKIVINNFQSMTTVLKRKS